MLTPSCCSLSATTTTTQPTCAQSNGAINVTPTPAGSYTYAWSDGPSTLQNRSGLAAGNYTVTITSTTVPTCTFSTAVTLNSNSSLTVTFSNQVDPTCTTTGSITATLAGGTAPYQITIDTGGTPVVVNSPIAGSQNVTGLQAGIITVSVLDGAGCAASAADTLVAPNSPTLTFSNQVDPTCAGNDGSVTATLAGGTGPYTITIDTGAGPFTVNSPIAGSLPLSNLHAGTITASVVDANGCSSSATVTLLPATNCCTHTVSAAFVQPTCGQADGSIMLTTSNGSGNYSYVWGGGETTPLLNNISAGNYPVTITDNGFANCFIATVFALTNPNAPVIDSFKILNVSCAGNGSDGSVSVYASSTNGIDVTTGYTWSNTSTDNDDTQADLAPGVYLFTVTDLTGCSTPGSVTIGLEAGCCFLQISADMLPPSCGLSNASITVNIVTAGIPPYTYSVDGVTYQAQNAFANLAPGSYSAIARDVNLCADTVAVIVPASSNNLNLTTTNTDVTCFGAGDGTATVNVTGGTAPYVYQWSGSATTATQTNLIQGTYTVTVVDNSSCTGSATAFITEPALLTINLGNDTTACEGTPLIITGPAGFAGYLWSNGETTQSITPLVAGTYSLTVTDANNCTASDAVDMNLVPAPLVDLGDDKFGYQGENTGIFANINQGTGTGGTYNWQPDTLLTCSDCQNPVSYAADTITYVLMYTDDYGCTGTDAITLNIMPVGDIYWPNAFSPNGDGNNDVFLPFGSGVKIINWQMFNRWGEKVFESNNFFYGCDGTYKGAPLPMGVYVYNAKVVLMNNAERKFKGTVTLFR